MTHGLEEQYSGIEDALTSIGCALDDLKFTEEQDAIAILKDVRYDLEHRLKAIGEALDREESKELAAMNAAYERSTRVWLS